MYLLESELIARTNFTVFKSLDEAVQHSIRDVEKIEKKIKEEDEAGILTYFETTRKETNEQMDFLTDDFVQMQNNCADDIQLTGKHIPFGNRLDHLCI